MGVQTHRALYERRQNEIHAFPTVFLHISQMSKDENSNELSQHVEECREGFHPDSGAHQIPLKEEGNTGSQETSCGEKSVWDKICGTEPPWF